MSPVRKFKRHVFVCTNDRPEGHPRGCCQSKNSAEVLKAMKLEVAKRPQLRAETRVQRAGCLDSCEEGTSVVVYPENVWYGRVKLEDVPQIVVEHLEGGKVVERLRMPGK